MELSDGTLPITSRIYLYNGTNLKSISIPSLPSNSFYMEEVIVKISESISFTKRSMSLDFHSTPQDVITVLGPPSKIYYKPDDKLRIHTINLETKTSGDYVYNYFNCGIDILFGGHSHVIKKIMLHTNYPCHYDFNSYSKCFFNISIPNTDKNAPEILPIDPHMKWDEIQSLLEKYQMGKTGKPLIYNRGSTANPFGATFYYAYKDIIFEVMRNNYIASVCLFKEGN